MADSTDTHRRTRAERSGSGRIGEWHPTPSSAQRPDEKVAIRWLRVFPGRRLEEHLPEPTKNDVKNFTLWYHPVQSTQRQEVQPRICTDRHG